MSSQDDLKKVVERLRKLHTMAEGARAVGNDAEAEAFAEGVQKILTAYKLDAALLTAQEVNEIDPMTHEWEDFAETSVGRKSRRIAWTERLARYVAEAHFCEMIIGMGGTNAVVFVGRTSDVQTARYVLMMLIRIGKESADKAYRKERYHMWKADQMEKAHGFRSAFLLGYVTRLGERLRELHRREVASDKRMGLIVVRSGEDIARYREENIKTKPAHGIGMSASGHSDALARGEDAGRRAADEANVNTHGVGGGKSAADRTRSAPKQIGRGE